MSPSFSRSDAAAPRGTIEAAHFRSVMSRFATGVTVTSYMGSNGPAALTANAFMSVSLDPPLVAVSIRAQSRFLAGLGLGSRLGISFLAHDQYSISDHFGGRVSNSEVSPFEIVEGVPLVRDCLAWIVGRVADIHPAGDHRLVVGLVEHLEEWSKPPLLFYGGRYCCVET